MNLPGLVGGEDRVMMGGSFEKVKELFVDQRLMGEFDSKAKGQNYMIFSELNPAEFVK